MPDINYIRGEIERMRVQVGRQRKEILQLQRAGIGTASAEALLSRMQAKIDDLCSQRGALKVDQPGARKRQGARREEVVSKTFNRAQAKAYRDEQLKLREDEEHKKNVRAELKVLGDFRHYMQRERSTSTTLGCLIAAVDAYVEQLTGDMHSLWASSVDIKRWWDERF